MTSRISAKPDYVLRCFERIDGTFTIVTRQGHSGISQEKMEEGDRVVIRGEKAERP
ncbi:hypothetical protein ACO2Q0_02740 [Phenylobacterium sp. VNQ135]|uniref:hypothetical protein n=1 Tax=Phenylobacterium sp. VNQ135 TaxID=3400922 RepID=UPI003C0F24D7